MIVKINKSIEEKLGTISKRSGVKKPELIQKIMLGFIERYEHEKGPIMSTDEVKLRRKNNETYVMYLVYKKHYFSIFDKEYESDVKAEQIDLRNIKLIKNKIMNVVIEQEKSDIIAVDGQDLINAFDFFLSKMPEWWKQNSFTLSSIYRNFEKILKQIQNERQSGKNALDDFLNSFSGG